MLHRVFIALLLLPLPLLAAHPILPGFERFHGAGQEPEEGGRLLLGELNCSACHGGPASAELSRHQAPILDNVASRLQGDYIKRFLADPQGVKPGTLMPSMFKDGEADKVAAVAAFLSTLAGQPYNAVEVQGGGKRGEQLFETLGCVACHSARKGVGAKLRETDDYETPSVPLGDLGAKYKVDGLADFLLNPLAVRPSGRMPSFRLEAKDAGTLAVYLTGANPKNTGGSQGVPPSENGNQVRYRYVQTDGTIPKDFAAVKDGEDGTLGGIMLRQKWDGDKFAVEYTTNFYAEQAGKYEFITASDDESFLYIDGKQIVDNGGIHPVRDASGTVELTVGFHALRLVYNEIAGQQGLFAYVRGPGIGRQYIPARLLSLDRTPPAPAADDKAVKVDPNAPSAELIAKGAELYRSMGCASCHALKIDGKKVESSVKATALGKLSPTAPGCQNGAGSGPHFSLSPVQTTALAAALKTINAPADATPAAAIRRTLTALNCYACHERDGRGGPGEKRAKFFTSTEADMGPEGNIPPALDGVGAKLRPDALKKVLTDERYKAGDWPRQYVRVSMPSFGRRNVEHLLTDLPQVDGYVDDPAEVEGDVHAGRELVGITGLACVTCHQYAGNKSLGIQGPDLTKIPERVTKTWFKRWLLSPQGIREITRMPSFWPGGKAVNSTILAGNTDAQIDALWSFMKAPAGGRPPAGINSGNFIPLEAGAQPTIYRNFFTQAPSRGIGIAYPEHVNLLFDANYMRLVQVWRGDFVNAGIHWINRGQGAVSPIGEKAIDLVHADPLAFVKAGETWPARDEKKGDLPGRKSDSRFKGYTLDKAGRPTFTYTYRTVAVAEYYEPVMVDGKGAFRRTLTISSDEPLDGLCFLGGRGKTITPKADGYAVNDELWLRFELADWEKPEVRPNQAGFDLVIPIKSGKKSAVLTETISW